MCVSKRVRAVCGCVGCVCVCVGVCLCVLVCECLLVRYLLSLFLPHTVFSFPHLDPIARNILQANANAITTTRKTSTALDE